MQKGTANTWYVDKYATTGSWKIARTYIGVGFELLVTKFEISFNLVRMHAVSIVYDTHTITIQILISSHVIKDMWLICIKLRENVVNVCESQWQLTESNINSRKIRDPTRIQISFKEFFSDTTHIYQLNLAVSLLSLNTSVLTGWSVSLIVYQWKKHFNNVLCLFDHLPKEKYTALSLLTDH